MITGAVIVALYLAFLLGHALGRRLERASAACPELPPPEPVAPRRSPRPDAREQRQLETAYYEHYAREAVLNPAAPRRRAVRV